MMSSHERALWMVCACVYIAWLGEGGQAMLQPLTLHLSSPECWEMIWYNNVVQLICIYQIRYNHM